MVVQELVVKLTLLRVLSCCGRCSWRWSLQLPRPHMLLWSAVIVAILHSALAAGINSRGNCRRHLSHHAIRVVDLTLWRGLNKDVNPVNDLVHNDQERRGVEIAPVVCFRQLGHPTVVLIGPHPLNEGVVRELLSGPKPGIGAPSAPLLLQYHAPTNGFLPFVPYPTSNQPGAKCSTSMFAACVFCAEQANSVRNLIVRRLEGPH